MPRKKQEVSVKESEDGSEISLSTAEKKSSRVTSRTVVDLGKSKSDSKLITDKSEKIKSRTVKSRRQKTEKLNGDTNIENEDETMKESSRNTASKTKNPRLREQTTKSEKKTIDKKINTKSEKKTIDKKIKTKTGRDESEKKSDEPVFKKIKTERSADKTESVKDKTKDDTGETSDSYKVTSGVEQTDAKSKNKARRKRKIPEVKDQEKLVDESKQDLVSGDVSANQKPNRKRKVKTEIESKVLNGESEDETSCKKFVGAHVSIAGGLYKSVYEAKAINARAFAVFLRSTQRWDCKPLTDDAVEKFKLTLKEEGYRPDMVLPHGSYLMNCGSPDAETLQKSRDVLIDDLQRCERLGLTLFNFHPGSTCGKISVEESLDRIAESINIAHSKTKNVIPVIENMSCQGSTIGGKFTELRGIIDRVTDKSRIGICLDTCHAFAAGYDLSTEEGFQKMLTEFEDTVGFKYLKAMHLNDSKGLLGCHKDRHENIGKGHIGKDGFRRVMNCARFDGIPMILETPCPADNTYLKEIKLLNSMMVKI